MEGPEVTVVVCEVESEVDSVGSNAASNDREGPGRGADGRAPKDRRKSTPSRKKTRTKRLSSNGMTENSFLIDKPVRHSRISTSYRHIIGAFSLLALQIGLGVLFYSLIVEKWSFQNALYFTIGTITTVGYGNLAPSSDFSKLFTVLYALSGIITLGVVLGLVGLWLIKQTQIGHAELQQRREIERLDQFTECADPRWEKNVLRSRQNDRLHSTRSQLRQAMADAEGRGSTRCEVCWAFAPLLWMILLGTVVRWCEFVCGEVVRNVVVAMFF
jgi:hypothetical protein